MKTAQEEKTMNMQCEHESTSSTRRDKFVTGAKEDGQGKEMAGKPTSN